MTLSLLVVDPELEVLGELASGLRALGLEVAIADTCALALERARARRSRASSWRTRQALPCSSIGGTRLP